MITINLLQDGTDEFVYNEKKGEITVISGQMNIIDGFHRLMSMVVAVANNPNSDYITEVRFTNWDIQKCRNFINQEDKRNKIDKRYMNSVININKWGNKVVTKINESGSDLKGKIVTNPIVLKHNKALTMFDIMSDAIELGYEIKSNMDVYKISQWLVDFFDFIIGFYPDNFIGEDNIAKSKEISAINLPAMFVGYICISKHLYNQTNWEDKLNNILKDINFDINNPVWKDIGIIKDDKPSITLKRPQLKKIFNYFTTIVSKEVVYEN
jgi:hypothetical protein